MKKVIELHFGNPINVGTPEENIDANVDVYIEVSASAFSSPVIGAEVNKGVKKMITELKRPILAASGVECKVTSIMNLIGEALGLTPKELLDDPIIHNMSVADLLVNQNSTYQLVKKPTVDALEIYAYSESGALDAISEDGDIKHMVSHANKALAKLCDMVSEITGMDMSYYRELTEIQYALYEHVYNKMAQNIIAEQYLTYAEILLAIAKEHQK